jgi:uncharacterized membrane protein YbhN (UPF0104 family)
MNPERKRWLVTGVKIVLALLIMFFVGWQFYRDLEQSDRPPEERVDLRTIEIRPAWLAASAGLYLVSVLPGAWFWRHLHHQFGYPIPLYAALRAHYIGQLGKYSPGKALAVAIRSELIHPAGVPYGVSIIITFYEVLTGMAAGGIVAAVIYMLEPPGELNLGVHPLAIGAVLIGMCGIPLLPGVFNFVVGKMTARIQAVQLYRLPPVRFGTLATGLAVTAVGWCVQGVSVWAVLQALLPSAPELTPSVWAQCTAAIAFANVAGFVVIVAPAGVGVREYLLTILLASLGVKALLAAAAIVLRLDWIVAELLVAACTYWIKPRGEMPPEPK